MNPEINKAIGEDQLIAPQYDVIIVGGGLAGLTCAIVLAKANKKNIAA
jgi:ribulose 1,5-bisphosphate synthetase/thiazole synthase